MKLLGPRTEIWIQVCLDSKSFCLNHYGILQLNCILDADWLRKQNEIFIFFSIILFIKRWFKKHYIRYSLSCHLLFSRVSWNKKSYFKEQNQNFKWLILSQFHFNLRAYCVIKAESIYSIITQTKLFLNNWAS